MLGKLTSPNSIPESGGGESRGQGCRAGSGTVLGGMPLPAKKEKWDRMRKEEVDSMPLLRFPTFTMMDDFPM